MSPKLKNNKNEESSLEKNFNWYLNHCFSVKIQLKVIQHSIFKLLIKNVKLSFAMFAAQGCFKC